MAVSWTDEIVGQLKKRKKKEFVCHGMWTPSGYFHIGNIRSEIMPSHLVFTALEKNGLKARFNFVADDFDGMDKVPAGFSEEKFSKYVGIPYTKVPSPFEGFKSWADYFSSQLLSVLPEYGIKVKYHSLFECYREGKYNDFIKTALDKAEEIRLLWNRIAKADKQKGFYPLQVVCENCGKTLFSTVSGWDGKKVEYKCSACNFSSSISPFNGNSKLHWRVHWAATWCVFGTDFESGGKDHFNEGGSVDTGKAFCKEIFKTEPPVLLGVEFIQSKGKKLSGSKGGIIDLKEWLTVASPELLRYLNISYNPQTAIEFSLSDNSFVLLNDRFNWAERIYYGKEKAANEKIEEQLKSAYELSVIGKPNKEMPVQLKFSFASMVVQLYDAEKEFEKIISFLSSHNYVSQKIPKQEKEKLQKFLKRTGNWVKKYAPEEFKISFSEHAPEIEASSETKAAISAIASLLPKQKTEEEIQNLFFSEMKSRNLNPKEFFPAIYKALIGKEAGPKLGMLITAIGKEKVAERLNEVGK